MDITVDILKKRQQECQQDVELAAERLHEAIGRMQETDAWLQFAITSEEQSDAVSSTS